MNTLRTAIGLLGSIACAVLDWRKPPPLMHIIYDETALDRAGLPTED